MVNLNKLNTAKSAIALLANGVSMEVVSVVICPELRHYTVTFGDNSVVQYSKCGTNQFTPHLNIKRITEVALPCVKGWFKKKPVGVQVERLVSDELKAERARIALGVSLYGYRGM